MLQTTRFGLVGFLLMMALLALPAGALAAPAVTLAPAAGPSGTTVAVRATGLTSNASYLVQLVRGSGNVNTVRLDEVAARTDANGQVTANLTVQQPAGTYAVRVVEAGGTIVPGAEATFTVTAGAATTTTAAGATTRAATTMAATTTTTAGTTTRVATTTAMAATTTAAAPPALTLTPASGPCGSQVTIRGAGFVPGEAVALFARRTAPTTAPGAQIAEAQARADGSFAVERALLGCAEAADGAQFTIFATRQPATPGRESTVVASAVFTVRVSGSATATTTAAIPSAPPRTGEGGMASRGDGARLALAGLGGVALAGAAVIALRRRRAA